MNHSLRRRLLFLLASATLLVWLASAVSSYLDARAEVGELFDAQLSQAAHTLLGLSRHELSELRDMNAQMPHTHFVPDYLRGEQGHRYEHKLSYQIWLISSGKLLLRSDTAPLTPLSNHSDGFSDQTIQGHAWRIYSLSDPKSDFRIQIGEHYDIRDRLISGIARRVAAPILIALPLLLALLWFGVGRALRPLARLAGEIGERAPHQLAPVDARHAPEEVRPLVEALNTLFGRVERAFDNERRFTADAAHELRTPLAALRTQAQVALRMDDETARRHALQQVVAGVDRATRLVEQLLTLARLDPERDHLDGTPVDLCTVAMETAAALEPAASARQITLGLAEPCRGTVAGHGDSLAILLRNLIDNAVRYTPEGGEVEVTVGEQDGRVRLSVADSGPGIPEVQRERVFDRFFRGGAGEASGSGLGLSIVGRIAQLHGAQVHLDRAALGGLLVEITFPGAAQRPDRP